MPEEATQPDLDLSGSDDAQRNLHRCRYKQARIVGMSWFDAKQFADSKIDIEEMRSLARKGFPPERILDYLLD